MELEFREELKIDPDALDVEWLNQPELLWKYSKLLEDEKKEAEYLKNRVELVKAELDDEIRSSPEKFGFEGKPTEKAIDAQILKHPKYSNILKKYLRHRHNVGVYQSAVFAVHQRKEALEHLVKLHGQKYFSSPIIEASLSDRQKERYLKGESAKSKIKRSMKRRRSNGA